MKEELPKYQEGVDYQLEEKVINDVLSEKNYRVVSERMKKGIEKWNAVQSKEDFFGLGDFDNFAHWFFQQGQSVADYHRQQPQGKEEKERSRQKFISENNPPKFWSLGVNATDEKFNQLQKPLTTSEIKALNDPTLTHREDWEQTLWFITRIRQAESNLYPEEDFALSEVFEKESKNDTHSSNYKAAQALQRVGISLDKFLTQVAQGRQVRLRKAQEQAQRDKVTILAHLDNWICSGSDTIHNWKTSQTLTLNKNGEITRIRVHFENNINWESEKIDEKEMVEGGFDAATFGELRTAIFQNLLKKLRKNKNYLSEYQKKYGWQLFKKENYSSAEFEEIQKVIGGSGAFDSENNSQNSSNNSPLSNQLIMVGIVGSLVILVLVGGLFLIKKIKNSCFKGKNKT